MNKIGHLEIVTGCMFSGKTTSLINYYNNLIFVQPIIAFKPVIDNRYSETEIVSHDGKKIPAIPFTSLGEIEDYLRDHQEVKDLIIDEIHFCPVDTYQWFDA